MAVLDSSANEIVIRVVYDGPPEAGKTTSLRSLAGSLAQRTTTPEEDASGRTLWFDWMEYVGGRFEGSKIRCQIVSVPGQRVLRARRRRLLEGADVVVSVFDSTRRGFATSVEYLRELRAQLARIDGPPVGVVLQANKRDVVDAVLLDEVRAALDGWSVGFVESVAADGTGIREAFVYAVRLALDRIRELMNRGGLIDAPPSLRSAAELLAALRGAEIAGNEPPPIIASSQHSVAAAVLVDVLDREEAAGGRTSAPRAGHVPAAPDSAVPSGAIWPPVEGRAILHEIAQLGVTPYQLSNGDWVMGLGCGWRIVSAREACFASLDEGRSALIQWARLHASCSPLLSSRRCIVLADAGDGSWRLWQIVLVEESLREAMQRAMEEATPELVVLRLCQGGQLLLDAAQRVRQAACELPCTLDTIGVHEGAPVYIGLMPAADPTVPPPIRNSITAPMTLLESQLGPIVAAARIGEKGLALQRVIDRVPRPVLDPEGIMATLVTLFS